MEPSHRGDLGALMQRLKSREARAKVESNRDFLTDYRTSSANPKNDERLDRLLQATAQRADELRQRSEELQIEAAEAERRLERVSANVVSHTSDSELQGLGHFERSQRRIQEDKREEELARLRDEAQGSYVRAHRKLQGELIELRDYKVLLRELRRLRLEKLQEGLGKAEDGRALRKCIREMIRHGAQRLLQRLDASSVALEQWMREVLVNSCHLEIRIEDAEERLRQLRRQALGSLPVDLQTMMGQSASDRFEALCVRTWTDTLAELDAENGVGTRQQLAPNEGIAAEMEAVEADIAAVKRLISDMRQNAAAVICHRIRGSEKGGSQEAERAMEWGFRKLKLLISEEFAKTTMKELQKSAPQGKLVL